MLLFLKSTYFCLNFRFPKFIFMTVILLLQFVLTNENAIEWQRIFFSYFAMILFLNLSKTFLKFSNNIENLIFKYKYINVL